MVGRELPDPCGTEFGIVADEVTYGSDLEGAMRNLYFRVGQDDLPLFVTAVAIQGSTGGNLSEILENLSGVIRLRFKMRRKVRALASEGRASAHDPRIAADRDVRHHQSGCARLLFQRLEARHDQGRAGGRGRLDERRHLHHVPHGQLQDLNMDFNFTLFGDQESTLLTLMVFLATAILTFAMMAMIRVHGAVRRRTAGINAKLSAEAASYQQHAQRKSGFSAAERIINYAQKHYGENDNKDMKVLRKRLVLAGIYDSRGVAVFFLARTALAVGLA